MPAASEVAGVGLDTCLHHLRRATEIFGELLSEQKGMPETHILENLAIFEAETASTASRLESLIGEMRKAA